MSTATTDSDPHLDSHLRPRPIFSTDISAFSHPRAVIGISIKGDAGSKGFISVPGTHTPEDDALSSMVPDLSPGSAHLPETSPGPYTPRDIAPGYVPRIYDSVLPETLPPLQLSAHKEPNPIFVPKLLSLPEDPSSPIKGAYRLLDLITEQGSSGLVDKIVIAEQSLQALINVLSPGAYSSITEIDFKKLDDRSVKPLGVYGSKEEIVRFLREIRAVDDDTAGQLLTPQKEFISRGEEPVLRSGLYVLRSVSLASVAEEQAYVLYWPEDATWNDQAVSTIQRDRRVTFMRFLTKLCDQIVCLLSSEQSQAIVDAYNDYSGLIFDFFVSKTIKQEDNVVVRPGFTVDSPLIVRQQLPPGIHIDHQDLSPRLLYGETMQGFMTAEFKEGEMVVDEFDLSDQGTPQIHELVGGDVVLCLSDQIDDDFLAILMKLGPGLRFANEFKIWETRRDEILQRFQATRIELQQEKYTVLGQHLGNLEDKLRAVIIKEVFEAFPNVRPEVVLPNSSSIETAKDQLNDLFRLSPESEQAFKSFMHDAHLEKGITDTDFVLKKERILILYHLLENIDGLTRSQIRALADAVLNRQDKQTVLKHLKVAKKKNRDSVNGIAKGSKPMTKEEALWRAANDFAKSVTDSRFLSELKSFSIDESLNDATAQAEEAAYIYLRKIIEALAYGISRRIFSIRKAACDEKIEREIIIKQDRELRILRSEFVHQVEKLSRERSQLNPRSIYVDYFEAKENYYSPVSCSIKGRQEYQKINEIEYHVHTLRLRAEQKRTLQLDPSFVPTPILNDRRSHPFFIPSETIIKYAHLLEGDRILLCLVDSQGNVTIFLDKLSSIDVAIKNKSHAKFLRQDEVGHTSLFSFDESKRMLAVCASKMQLHIFVFDEQLKSLERRGTEINLLPFYNTGVSTTHACFVHGSEEILFVDSSAQARIFSLITLLPRPASLQLSQIPRAIYSSPDGSCVLIAQEDDGVYTLRAYLWSTFGSTAGISVALPDFPVDLNAALLTSIMDRNNIHLVGLNLESQSCRSVVLDITLEDSEFTFQERPSEASSDRKHTIHNGLIDCYADVWSQFPVVPAMKLHKESSSEKKRKSLVFVTNGDGRPFASYFYNLIHTFERTSRKPTGDELRGISVSARTLPYFVRQLSGPDWPVSSFRAGEWLSDLLCLIPIQIAISQDNGFIPLKDGIVSTQLEKSLLGAGVNEIIDSLSLGWYESMFRSYWASRPVKVVSSMGEHSVEKSYTLNHLVDTSFVGSEMRSSEGVWMSVSPTDDEVIVALDFEGVHSLERSTQEDMLLSVFDSAISNLVLFHNNIALSPDISGIIQSFQSSSSVLDPTSNPSLFQSALVVIISDVIDSDRAEVATKFSHNFREIVKEKQGANFITRLHTGELQIIPWPVIESEEFYRPFSALQRKLDKQTSLRTAGEFLHTMKTLMAKLKANDWVAVS